jgi:hypothetical protein
MARNNPDPHEDGYVYQPTKSVTAFFPAGQDLHAMLSALSEAGFASAKVDVFAGEQGAARLDSDGAKHGAWVRFRRGLEHAFADESEVHERGEQVLRSGGSIVAVRTDGEATQKDRAATTLKTHHGAEVTYWGNMVIERL